MQRKRIGPRNGERQQKKYALWYLEMKRYIYSCSNNRNIQSLLVACCCIQKLLFQRMVDASYRAVKKVRIHSGFKFLGMFILQLLHVTLLLPLPFFLCFCILIEKEYRAIFMSILESALPDSEQSPGITKCLCNPYVLNTTLAHVQSVVVSVGNPFKLLRSEEIMVNKYGNRAKCWTEYLRLCLSNGTFISTKSLSTKLQELL